MGCCLFKFLCVTLSHMSIRSGNEKESESVGNAVQHSLSDGAALGPEPLQRGAALVLRRVAHEAQLHQHRGADVGSGHIEGGIFRSTVVAAGGQAHICRKSGGQRLSLIHI